jgi:hypothetical protein
VTTEPPAPADGPRPEDLPGSSPFDEPGAPAHGVPDPVPGAASATGSDAGPDTRRRRGLRPGGLVAVALVAAGAVLGGALVTRDLGPDDAPVPSTSSTVAAPVRPDEGQVRLDAMDELLLARSAALLARDRDAWLATVDPASTDFATRQAAFFDNLAEVPLTDVRMEYAGDGPALSAQRAAEVGPGAWVARVSFVYRVAEADIADVRRDRYLTFVERPGGWLVADDTDGGKNIDLWDLGPVTAVRGERSLVLGTGGDAALLTDLAARSDAAARAVDEVWGTGWPRTAVVLVPADQAQMAALLNRADETGLDQIAAVTTGEVGEASGPAADRIIVNPAGFARLRDVGPDVVLTHEMTHVAVRARGPGQGPLWVSEGFADYVAYAGRDLSRRQVAGDVLDLVDAGAGPTALPTDADFDPRQGDIAPAYSSSWLAIEMIGRTYGRDALLAFVHAQVGTYIADGVSGQDPVPVEQAARDHLGTELATVEAQWLDDLQELAD